MVSRKNSFHFLLQSASYPSIRLFKPSMFRAQLFLLLALSAVEAHPPHLERRQWTVGQNVKTTSGTVLGHAAKYRAQVSEYLGIPFAKPPVGELRWRAPQKFTGTANINASAFVRNSILSE